MKIYSSRTQSDLDTYKQYAGQNVWLRAAVSIPYAPNDMHEYINIIMIRDNCIYFREVHEMYLHDNDLSTEGEPDVEYAGIDDPVRCEIDHFCATTTLVRPLDIFTNAEMEELLQMELNDTENMISITEDEWDL